MTTTDNWEDITASVQVGQGTIDITLLTTRTSAGKRFGAGRVYVHLFGAEVPCVALLAGQEKYIIPPEHGVDWLVERGLDRTTAERLVHDAMRSGHA